MGAIGGVLRATSGPPQFSTVSSVKNPALQGNIDSLISGYGAAANAGDTALNQYISRYMANQGTAQKQTNQEVGAIGQFYNGAMSNQLAQLRATRAKAVTDAANVASQQAIAAQNRSRVGGGGGMGSYDTRMTMANLTPIRTQAALDNANQERADLGYVTGNQLALTGARQGLENQQAAYGLVPEQTRMAMLGQRAGYLGQLGNLDQQNKFYGLQQQPNMWADVADSLDQGIMNAAAMYSSVAGAGGGGGGMSRGGVVRGPGSETSDSIPARLSKGEFVIPAEAVHIPGMLPLLERIRRLALAHRDAMHLASGGIVMPAHHAAVSPWGRGPDGYYSRGGMVRYYADGGLAASAQQLGARAMADLTPQWGGAVMIGQNGAGAPGMAFPGGGGGGGGGGMARNPNAGAPAMPVGANFSPNPYFTPQNYDSLTPQWKAYGNSWSNYYNNPSSPGYVVPGTYE